MTKAKPKEARLPGYKTAKQAAEEWGYNYTYLNQLLNEQDRVPRAVKIGGRWFIPDYVEEKHVRRHPGRPIKPLPPEKE